MHEQRCSLSWSAFLALFFLFQKNDSVKIHDNIHNWWTASTKTNKVAEIKENRIIFFKSTDNLAAVKHALFHKIRRNCLHPCPRVEDLQNRGLKHYSAG